MNRRLLSIGFLLLSLSAAAAPIPCKLGDYRVVAPNRVAFDCNGMIPAISGTATVWILVNGSVAGQQVATGSLSVSDRSFLVIDLQTPLASSGEYEILLSGSPATPFEDTRQRISTKASGTLALPVRADAKSLRYGEELWLESTNELIEPPNHRLVVYSEDAPEQYVPHTAKTDANRDELARYGAIRLDFYPGDAPKRLNARMKVDGIKDVFGQPVSFKWQKRAAPASSPKTKDDAYYYAKLLHQAGLNSKPAFILDGKIAPIFPIRQWRNTQLRPSATADIGQGGAIGKTKTNDIIQFGLGVGRFLRTEHAGALQGIDPTIGFVYETNYELAHKNALFVGEAQWFLAGTDGYLKQKNFLLYMKQKGCDPDFLNDRGLPCDKDLEPQDAVRAFFGYRFQFYTGVETGSQISVETGKASSGNSKVEIPKYLIARVYPKISLALDLSQRFTLTLAGTGRYLFATENVYRERDVPSTTGGDPTKEVYLTTASGFRPSGEFGLAFALDDAGHYALSSAVKVGSLPPNFVRVATVQTGLTIKF